jgi:adenine deaminase
MFQQQIVNGQIIDIHERKIFAGRVIMENGRIKAIEESNENENKIWILPGFIDSHIHIESSMLTPFEFARKALVHGTVATVSDPHEIANVCGLEGVNYMLENAGSAKLKFNFGAPSCVPATTFETAGAVLDAPGVNELLARPDILYLSEMMNYPGVLFKDPAVLEKISLAQKYGKPVDGHAPGLTGKDAVNYIAAGISTDHECYTKEEALWKLKHGMKILIREGSAARNFEALHELISEYPDMVMLCSDDKHPDELLEGHINLVVKRALQKGHDMYDVLRCASLNPVMHYKLQVGLLRVGDPADFIVIDHPDNFNVLQTWINGELVAEKGVCMFEKGSHPIINNISCNKKKSSDFTVHANGENVNVIQAIDGQLITRSFRVKAKIEKGNAVTDVSRDILKLTVVNRYGDEVPSTAFIEGFGLETGAIASSVAHDSHNIIAVGVDDDSICTAVNLLIEHKGGLCVVNDKHTLVLPLPIAGLMSEKSCDEVGLFYSQLDQKVKQAGCKLRAPFMTLSFMALLVIPELKLSDKGLFDGKKFSFTELFIE